MRAGAEERSVGTRDGDRRPRSDGHALTILAAPAMLRDV
jgi:hypothetical protein